MKTIDIMTPNPQCVSPEDTLTEAAEQMKRLNVGMLPVCRDDHLIGVLTDRDIAIRGVANGLDPKQTKVRSIMSRLIISCFADQDQEAAATIMESHRVRRLPVLDRDDQLIGIISLSDLAARTGDEDLASRVLERLAAQREP
jgi:CBS domain-containing protein